MLNMKRIFLVLVLSSATCLFGTEPKNGAEHIHQEGNQVHLKLSQDPSSAQVILTLPPHFVPDMAVESSDPNQITYYNPETYEVRAFLPQGETNPDFSEYMSVKCFKEGPIQLNDFIKERKRVYKQLRNRKLHNDYSFQQIRQGKITYCVFYHREPSVFRLWTQQDGLDQEAIPNKRDREIHLAIQGDGCIFEVAYLTRMNAKVSQQEWDEHVKKLTHSIQARYQDATSSEMIQLQ